MSLSLPYSVDNISCNICGKMGCSHLICGKMGCSHLPWIKQQKLAKAFETVEKFTFNNTLVYQPKKKTYPPEQLIRLIIT